MAAQKGRDLLIKIGDGATPTENFTTLAGLRSKSISLGAEAVDITDSGSANQWREVLEGAGTKTASVSGSGVFRDDAAAETARGELFAGTIANYEIVIPDFGTIKGPFQITTMEFAGEFNGAVTYSLSLESAGAITFTAG